MYYISKYLYINLCYSSTPSMHSTGPLPSTSSAYTINDQQQPSTSQQNER